MLKKNFDKYCMIIFFLLIISIWAFNEEKYITYPIKVIFIMLFGIRWIIYSKFKISYYQLWCIIMLLLSVTALLISSDFQSSLHTFINLIQVFLIAFTAVAFIDNENKIDYLLIFIIIGGCLLGVRLLVSTPLSALLSFQRIGEAIGYNANDVGNKAAISAVIAIVSIKEKKGKDKIILLLCSIFLIIIVLFSGSRKSLISVILAVLLLNTIGLKNKKNLIFGIIGFIVFFFLIYYIIMNNTALYATIGRRIESMIDVFRYGQSEASSIDLREKYMQIAFGFVKENPLTGIGLGNFASKSGLGVYCHCDYLEVMCSYGVFGAIIYYFPIIYMVYILIRERNSRKDFMFLIINFVLLINYITMVMYISVYTQILVLICISYIRIEKYKKRE